MQLTLGTSPRDMTCREALAMVQEQIKYALVEVHHSVNYSEELAGYLELALSQVKAAHKWLGKAEKFKELE